MHELSIATSLVDVVTEHLIASGATRVGLVIVEVGDLSGVVPEQLASAFKVAVRGELGFEDVALELRPVPVKIDCARCGPSPAQSPSALRCVHCGTPSASVIIGRELEVVSIEVFDAAENA